MQSDLRSEQGYCSVDLSLQLAHIQFTKPGTAGVGDDRSRIKRAVQEQPVPSATVQDAVVEDSGIDSAVGSRKEG